MRRHIILFAVLSVGLVAAFLPQVEAGQPGGQTVGGEESINVLPQAGSAVPWECTSCGLPACVTVAVGVGLMTVRLVSIPGPPVIPDVTRNLAQGRSRTVCIRSLALVEVECLSPIDCSYNVRVDQIRELGTPLLGGVRSGNEPSN